MEGNREQPRTGDRLKWVPYEEECPDMVWEYTHLNEPELTAKFEELAIWGTLGDTEYATLQPCTNPIEASQDRPLVQDWDIDGKCWRFRAIFDGHGGHDTVDYTIDELPSLLLERLANRTRQTPKWTPPDISKILSDTIIEFDDGIGKAFLDLFPGNSIHESSDEELRAILNAPENAGTVLRCMRGTTVLIALVDPEGANLWVASLGDCTAILGTREPAGGWATQTLSFNHNGQNPAEAARVNLEHAGEEKVMEDDRVLGAIAVTRAIGDFVFKFPAIYTERGLLNCDAGFRMQRRVEDLLPRVLSPPYVSNVPQVKHVELPLSSRSCSKRKEQLKLIGEYDNSNGSSSSNGQQTQREKRWEGEDGLDDGGPVLLMFSDGLGDLYEDEFRGGVNIPGFWGLVFGKMLELPSPSSSSSSQSESGVRDDGLGQRGPVATRGSRAAVGAASERNTAMRFLREGLGARDEESVSRSLTSECEWKWMDDTTVLVVRL